MRMLAKVRAVPGWAAVIGQAVGRARPTPSVLVILLLGCIDLVWNANTGLVFTGWPVRLLLVLLLLGVSVVYSTVRPVRGLAELSLYAALWITFSIFGAISTYLAASWARPLQDAAFAAFDTSLRFDWVAWADTIRGWPVPRFVLMLCYGSLMPQLLGSIGLFAVAGVRGRNEEMLLGAALGLLPTTFCFALWPALGPFEQFGYGALHPGDMSHVADYLPDLLALRHGGTGPFGLGHIQGIICLPSYHTVLALLLIYAHRDQRWTLRPVAAVNGLMLISVPSEGGHYLADMVAGVAVTLVAVAAASWLCRRTPRVRAAS